MSYDLKHEFYKAVLVLSDLISIMGLDSNHSEYQMIRAVITLPNGGSEVILGALDPLYCCLKSYILPSLQSISYSWLSNLQWYSSIWEFFTDLELLW